MEERIIDIIEEVSGYRGLRENRDADLLQYEILDSLAFIELLTILEDEFDIEIQPTQIEPDTWRSLKKIVELVEEKTIVLKN